MPRRYLWCAVGSDINGGGVSTSGTAREASRESRHGRGAGVLEENGVAVKVANEGIEKFVAIDVREDRSG